jgi:hypothetical protein
LTTRASKPTWFKTREGLVLLVASAIYVSIWAVGKHGSIPLPLPTFLTWIGIYMPVALALAFFQIGGMKKDFRSSWFNTSMMVLMALVPVLVVLKRAVFG